MLERLLNCLILLPIACAIGGVVGVVIPCALFSLFGPLEGSILRAAIDFGLIGAVCGLGIGLYFFISLRPAESDFEN